MPVGQERAGRPRAGLHVRVLEGDLGALVDELSGGGAREVAVPSVVRNDPSSVRPARKLM